MIEMPLSSMLNEHKLSRASRYFILGDTQFARDHIPDAIGYDCWSVDSTLERC